MASKITATSIHHIAIRVVDAAASKAWFVATLGFRVEREFSYAGLDIVWLCADGETRPVIELVGGGDLQPSRFPEDAKGGLRQPGMHHVCLQVDDVEKVVAALRAQDVTIVMDVKDGAPGSGVKKGAFFAGPAGNLFELLELA